MTHRAPRQEGGLNCRLKNVAAGNIYIYIYTERPTGGRNFYRFHVTERERDRLTGGSMRSITLLSRALPISTPPPPPHVFSTARVSFSHPGKQSDGEEKSKKVKINKQTNDTSLLPSRSFARTSRLVSFPFFSRRIATIRSRIDSSSFVPLSLSILMSKIWCREGTGSGRTRRTTDYDVENTAGPILLSDLGST